MDWTTLVDFISQALEWVGSWLGYAIGGIALIWGVASMVGWIERKVESIELLLMEIRDAVSDEPDRDYDRRNRAPDEFDPDAERDYRLRKEAELVP